MTEHSIARSSLPIRWPSRLLIGVIRTYQYAISPFFGQRCRFHPNCSAYAVESLQSYGVLKGIWLTLKRLGRCHPWHAGGYDPVP